jgi:lauroyl/myristoyl acyltransferase
LYNWIGKLTANDQALRRLAAVFYLFPQSLIYLFCRVAGVLFYFLAGAGLRDRIRSNMHDLLPTFSNKAVQHDMLAYYGNLAVTLYEIILGSYQLERAIPPKLSIRGEENLQMALKQGKGAIVYAPHMGNFFYYYWYLCQHYDCLTIATAGSKELRPLYMKFKELGCKGLDYDDTPPLEMMRTLKKHLAAGGVVFILGDFWRASFPQSHFFGKTTRTPEGAALLAIENKAPIVPFYGYRDQGFRHKLVFEPAIRLDERFARTQRSEANRVLNHFMEKAIRQAPSNWFYWFNAEERWESPQVEEAIS